MAIDIEIPVKLRNLLKKDRSLESMVMASVAAFEDWLSHFGSGLPFFPEYTDHGPKHISGVLRSVSSLVADDAWKTLTPADAAALILAVVLHDSAMHLKEDGADEIIKSKLANCADPYFDKISWKDLWAAYLRNAAVWEDQKFEAVFGQLERSRPNGEALVRPLPGHIDLWDRSDRLLVGEFIRQYHPRLAHEIALFGVPGSLIKSGRLVLRVDERLADLAGRIARSHGMPVRESMDSLVSKYDLIQQVSEVHIVYLMGLLRIGDYLEIDASRAPKALDAVRKLHSPLSSEEWRLHQSIPIKASHPDPEAIYIEVKPPDVRIYLRATQLLASIQAEIDTTWAILGEVYQATSNESWSRLKLTVRRIRSNLERKERFARSVSYVPREVQFSAENSTLLKLLVLPLYGDNPAIGIRELVQNAVDAVRERSALDKKYKMPRDRAGEVVVSLCSEEFVKDGPKGWQHWVEVDDCGIGMNDDVICSYFLKVGASFRSSASWRTTFADKASRMHALRIGYFGIGVLAAFLLGDEIAVTTRSAKSEIGYSFEATLSQDKIELQKFSRPVGTTIRVKASVHLMERLRQHQPLWDWFRLARPKVVRADHTKSTFLVIRGGETVPTLNANPPIPWLYLKTPQFPVIHWTYEAAPRLVCNGIEVRSAEPLDLEPKSWNWPADLKFSFLKLPNISIADPDRKFDLNLQRSQPLRKSYPFGAELCRAVCRDFIAFCLVHAPQQRLGSGALQPHRRGYPGWRRDGLLGSPTEYSMWIDSASGVSIMHPWFLAQLRPTTCLCLALNPEINSLGGLPSLGSGGIVTIAGARFDEAAIAVASLAFAEFNSIYNFSGFGDFGVERCQALVPKGVAQRLEDLERVDEYQTPFMSEIFRISDCSVWSKGEASEPSPTLQDIQKSDPFKKRYIQLAGEWDLSTLSSKPVSDPLVVTWMDLLGTPFIPLDPVARQKDFATAFEELAPLIERWNRVPTASLLPKSRFPS